MTPKKIAKAFAQADCFKGSQTQSHILKNLQDDAGILSTLTAKQLSAVINVANCSYHDGKSICKAEVFDDCIWICGDVQKLIPLRALQAIEIDEQKTFNHEGYQAMLRSNKFSLKSFSSHKTTYTLNYTESS